MKKKLALAFVLCAIVSILSLNFKPVSRNVANSGESNKDYDDEDAPIEVHNIYSTPKS